MPKQVKGVAYGNFRRRAQNDKKLVTTKGGSCDQFLTKLKFLNLGKAEDGWIQNFFLIVFDIWNIEIRVRIQKLDQF